MVDRVIYLFRKSDLRLTDSLGLQRAIEKAIEKPSRKLHFVVCLGIDSEWRRLSTNSGLVATGRQRRRFYWDSIRDIEESLKVISSKKNEGILSISPFSFEETVKKLDAGKQKTNVQHLFATKELGSYEDREENAVKGKVTVVVDDTMVPLSEWDQLYTNKDVFSRQQYSSFRKTVETPLSFQKQKVTEFGNGTVNHSGIPAERFVEKYCPHLSPSIQLLSPSSSDATSTVFGSEITPKILSTRSSSTVGNSTTAPDIGTHDELNVDYNGGEDDSMGSFKLLYSIKDLESNSEFQDVLGDIPRTKYKGGERAALQRLKEFFWDSDAIQGYKHTRNQSVDMKSNSSTSKSTGIDLFSSHFSPYMAVGNLSARSILHELAHYEAERGANESTYWLIFEFLWRDYLHFAIRLQGEKFFMWDGIKSRQERFTNSKKSRQDLFDYIAKESDKTNQGFLSEDIVTTLAAITNRNKFNIPESSTEDYATKDLYNFLCWTQGRTGFPFIDSAMLELKETGFMSNRCRQNVASFLVHTLECPDWRWGAEWFEQCLLDHDVASNWGNWITVVGCGFQDRKNVFNVVKQSGDYEKDGLFMKKWYYRNIIAGKDFDRSVIPDGNVAYVACHMPWELPDDIKSKLRNKGCYLDPIINPRDHFRYSTGRRDDQGKGGKGNKGGSSSRPNTADSGKGKRPDSRGKGQEQEDDGWVGKKKKRWGRN